MRAYCQGDSQDIQNAYITATFTGNILTVLDPEFGEDDGRKDIVVQSIYVFKSAGSTFWNRLADCMHHLGFLPCPVNLYFCMNPMVSPYDGFNYYAYIIIYVDGVIIIHHDSKRLLSRIDNYFNPKTSSIGDTYIYVGSKLNKIRLDNGYGYG